MDNMSEKMRWAFQATLKIYFEVRNTYDDDVHNQLTTTCWVVTLWLVSKPFFFVTCFIHGVKFKRIAAMIHCNKNVNWVDSRRVIMAKIYKFRIIDV